MTWVLIIWLAISVALLVYNPDPELGGRVIFGVLWPVVIMCGVCIQLACFLGDLADYIDNKWGGDK